MPNRILPALLFVFVSSLFAASALGQKPLIDGLKVNGIGLGAKQQEVIKKLGKPTSTVTTKKIDECIGSYIRTMTYPGLKLELDDTGGGYTVFSMEITLGNWDLSGAKLGDTTTGIQKRFGVRGRTVEKRDGGPFWFYDMTDDNPGGTSFYFRNGKLVKVFSTYTMC